MAESFPISAVMICRNAEQTIAATLESLGRFSEVIVYDNGSTDRTVELARGFPNVSVHEGEFFGFGPTKNHAATLASNDWVFSIDSDERISKELLESIVAADLSSDKMAYSVHRANYLCGKLVRFSGWGNDWLIRLYNRNATGLTDAAVHEIVKPPVGGNVRKINGDLFHDAVRQLGDFLVKIDRYSEIQREHSVRTLLPVLICLRSAWAFIRTYLLRLGFLDGWRGLIIAICDANGVFFKYMKPYADHAVALESRQVD
ncbi:MAG: glycosyltransferase family 2 protein [Gammaproteobacteria bacterium]|nr:glycosyltransferase family 2 protein [Gammaproteobacteria bacterium]